MGCGPDGYCCYHLWRETRNQARARSMHRFQIPIRVRVAALSSEYDRSCPLADLISLRSTFARSVKSLPSSRYTQLTMSPPSLGTDSNGRQVSLTSTIRTVPSGNSARMSRVGLVLEGISVSLTWWSSAHRRRGRTVRWPLSSSLGSFLPIAPRWPYPARCEHPPTTGSVRS